MKVTLNIISLSDEELECLQEIKLDLTMMLAYYNQHLKETMSKEDIVKLMGTQISMITVLESKIKKVSKLV